MNCKSCGTDNREGRKFCAGCGVRLAVICDGCGAANEVGEVFCGECGASLVDGRPSTPHAVSTPDEHDARTRDTKDGERRQLTVLFCDLVGSTPLSQQLDAEEWRDLIAQYQQAASGAVVRFGGHVAKNLGDGLLIYFGWPTVHRRLRHARPEGREGAAGGAVGATVLGELRYRVISIAVWSSAFRRPDVVCVQSDVLSLAA